MRAGKIRKSQREATYGFTSRQRGTLYRARARCPTAPARLHTFSPAHHPLGQGGGDKAEEARGAVLVDVGVPRVALEGV
eukprot:67340-Pleurochrysis_carterae.AAC.1